MSQDPFVARLAAQGDILAHLSSGQWQIIANLAALAKTSSGLIVFDEPTAYLDPAHEALIADTAAQAVREGIACAALVITHSDTVAARCTRVVTMDAGRMTAA